MRAFLENLWCRPMGRPNLVRPLGRPSQLRTLQEEQIVAISNLFAEDIAISYYNDSAPDYFNIGDEVKRLYEEKGWKRPLNISHDLDDGGGADDGEGADEEQKHYRYSNPGMKFLIQAYIHKWDKKKKHLEFRSPHDFREQVKEHIGLDIPDSTARRWIKEEKRLFDLPPDSVEGSRAMRSKPCVYEMLQDLVQARKEIKGMEREAPPDAARKNGRPFTFEPAWYPLLIAKLDSLVSTCGFGVPLVASFAMSVLREQTGIEDGEDDQWIPSTEWCHWFMKKKMNLSVRRANGSPICPLNEPKQLALHKINVQRIAVALHEGLQLKYIIGADEFGMHLFPQANWVWTRKGSKEAKSALKPDKRQYTGDVAHNAAGGIVCVHQIFKGSTAASLPPEDVRQKFPQFQFAVTPNHWANHPTKIAFVQRIWEWVVTEHMKDFGWSREEAVKKAKCILFLDCWPVNLTAIFRQTIRELCPGMVIMYIPAGYTGQVQVCCIPFFKVKGDKHAFVCEKQFLPSPHQWLIVTLAGQRHPPAQAAEGCSP
jgi:hypothetical protein